MALGDIVTVHLYWFATPYGTGGLYEFLPRELGSLAFILRNIHTCCWFLLVSVLTLKKTKRESRYCKCGLGTNVKGPQQGLHFSSACSKAPFCVLSVGLHT